MPRRKKHKINKAYIPLSLIILIGVASFSDNLTDFIPHVTIEKKYHNYDIGNIPEYSGEDYIILNNNEPYFSLEDAKETFETYSELDSLGRCGIAYANIDKSLMPIEERGSIGMIKPSGWHTVKYDFVDGKYLYNRCHLIGFQLTGENANEKNLITCTRSMNAKVMVEFENRVANYIKTTNNHVLYRVTPLYKDDNLLASGVEIEAKSVEDVGKGINFNIYIYNVEKGVVIDYKTGNSKLATQ